MTNPLETRLRSLAVLLAATVAFLASAGCSDDPASNASRAAGPAVTLSDALSDESLPAYRVDLLELAFDASSKMPANPHIKNRSKAQEAVVEACLELGQPKRGLTFARRIGNWRRGLAYANLAHFCAKRGMAIQSQHYLKIASEIAADVVNDENPQEWRRDRVRARIAETYLLLGRPDLADPYRAGVLESEATSLEAARAAMADADAFDDRMKVVDELLARGSLDQIRTALETSAQLFDRFYDDQGRRSEAERRVRLAYDKLPIMIRIDLLTRLAESATAHGDPSKAKEIIDAARSAIDRGTWLPEDHVPLLARLATIRHRAGDEVGARREAADALALYDRRREEIGTVFRAEALRPLAEAYQAMGDAANALHIYRRALADGAENPNGRPRAMDLAATCCSMAVHGVEPDADAWALIRKINDTLETPW